MTDSGARRCRFIVDGAAGAYENLALEEALLEENAGLVTRVWSNEKSVVIGRAQLARFETDLEYCQKNGVPIVRRVTAGGAVYNGPGNVNWSLFVGRGFDSGGVRYIWGVGELFKMAASLVTEAASSCGAETWLEPPNRILSSDGKVSGMATYLSRRGLLCHGTLLLDADLEEAKRLTDPSAASLQRRYTRSNPMTMANTGIGLPSFIAAIRGVVANRTGMELENDEPTESESKRTRALLAKYRDPRWNLGDPFRV